jgi:hypothetical protein
MRPSYIFSGTSVRTTNPMEDGVILERLLGEEKKSQQVSMLVFTSCVRLSWYIQK